MTDREKNCAIPRVLTDKLKKQNRQLIGKDNKWRIL